MSLGPQPRYRNGVNEDYQRFVDEGAASLAASMAEREQVAAQGLAYDAAAPPSNEPNLNTSPTAGPSPQPTSSPNVRVPYDNRQFLHDGTEYRG